MNHSHSRERFADAWREQTRRIAPLFDKPALRWLRRHGFWIAATLAVLGYFWPALSAHMERASNPLIVTDDARILIWPFFRYEDAELFRKDAIARYYLDSLPDIYRTLYMIGAKIVGAAQLSKALPYVMLGVLTASMAFAARRIAGRAPAIVAAVLTLGSALFLARMVGGLPRGFAYPLLGLGAAFLAYGNVWGLAALVCAGAGLYPVTTVVLGLCLAGLLLLLRAEDRGTAKDWPLKKRLLVLAGTAALAALVVAPAALRLRHYGQPITPNLYAEYPEAGPGGRFLPEDRPPFPAFLEAAYPLAQKTLFGAGDAFVPGVRAFIDAQPTRKDTLLEILIVAVLAGWSRLAFASAAARRVLLLALAAFAGHLLSGLVTPHLFLPQRYVQYPVPVLSTLLVATFWAGFTRERSAPHGSKLVVVFGCLLVLGVFAAGGSGSAGLNVVVRSHEAGLYRAIAALPKDACIAGWPGRMNNVPYFGRRGVLLSWELHMPFHTGFTALMRERMRALIRANYASDRTPLDELRNKHGVSHLFFDTRDFGKAQTYFRPFDRDIAEALQKTRGKPRELERQVAVAAVWQKGSSVLIDLSKLAP